VEVIWAAKKAGPIRTDLTKLPHVLSGGHTNTGKSVFVGQAITWLALHNSRDRLRLVTVDLKGGVEFNLFDRLPHGIGRTARDLETCILLLKGQEEELERRQELLDRAGVEDVHARTCAFLTGHSRTWW